MTSTLTVSSPADAHSTLCLNFSDILQMRPNSWLNMAPLLRSFVRAGDEKMLFCKKKKKYKTLHPSQIIGQSCSAVDRESREPPKESVL